MPSIYPSLISSDLLNLERTLKKLDPYCTGYHLDIMDNHFVPNLTWGPQFANAISQATHKHLWVHLMIKNPINMLTRLNLPPKSMISVHVETNNSLPEVIHAIKAKHWCVSLTISPKTNVSVLLPQIGPDIDQILIMSVEPGFSGQKFIPEVVSKIQPLLELRSQKNLNFKIGIDGGINKTNIALLREHGVDDFAIASGIFGSPDPQQALITLAELIKV